MTTADKEVSELVKDLEQTVSFDSAIAVAAHYIGRRKDSLDFNEPVFIESLAPHVLEHHLTVGFNLWN